MTQQRIQMRMATPRLPAQLIQHATAARLGAPPPPPPYPGPPPPYPGSAQAQPQQQPVQQQVRTIFRFFFIKTSVRMFKFVVFFFLPKE